MNAAEKRVITVGLGKIQKIAERFPLLEDETALDAMSSDEVADLLLEMDDLNFHCENVVAYLETLQEEKTLNDK